VIREPDFIIIGAMKCATSTLHEQLARQPGVFMSTPKEPNFFSDEPQWRLGLAWYQSLFAQAPPGYLCGESSTHYTKLPSHPHVIDRIARSLGDHVKFIYIMRHPIDRLVSHYIHEWSQRVLSCPIDQAINDHPALVQYSCYAMQMEPWLERLGPQRVLPVFYDRLTRHSQSELERIGRFLGCPHRLQWDSTLREQNVSAERLRANPVRDAILNLPGCRLLRRTLVPQPVRNRIKNFWTIRERPQLSDTAMQHLTGIFDADLHTLGSWLGCSLNCENFRSVALATEARWTSGAAQSRTVAA
jgi:hypothetical protein